MSVGMKKSSSQRPMAGTDPARPLIFQRFMGSVPNFYVPKFHIGNIPYFPDYGNAKYHEKEFSVTSTPPGGESCDRLV